MSEKESKSAATIRRRRNKTSTFSNSFTNATIRAHRSEDPFDSQEEDPEPKLEGPIPGPPVVSRLLSSEWTLFLGLVAFRLINALIIQTFYVPDEYWQSTEVAHKVAFGYVTSDNQAAYTKNN